jgi:hypothetical protein
MLVVTTRGWPDALGRRRLGEEQRDDEDDRALHDAEEEERLRIARRLDPVGDGDHGQSRAGAEPGGGESGGQAMSVGEPLQRIADAGAVHRTGAQPGDDAAA